ncbi:MAG: MFS transporter [Acutalibacteraceae bacterium]|nr:MFS transporter [Acutalibacteraceae bacterium]
MVYIFPNKGQSQLNSVKKLSYKSIVSLGFLVYFFSYAMRLNYSASLVAIVSDLKISNTMASAAVTGSFITYGIGQVICGFIGDKNSPVKMISVAMLGTILVNISVSFSSDIAVITVLWCINGVCQAMLWPPLTRFVSEQVGVDKYSDAITCVGLSASTGTIFVYLFVPIILEIANWRNVFRCMAIFGVIMMIVWGYATRNIPTRKAEARAKAQNEKTISVWGIISLAGLIPIFITISLHGILRDGIQTWLPSLMNEQLGLSESSSVLSAALLPVLSMASVLISNVIYHKTKSEIKTSAIMFGLAFAATVPLAIGLKIPALMTIVFSAMISGCMHGVNHMLISLIPKNFAKFGMVSTFSGILNAFTYIGASISSYGFAAIADFSGWNTVLISWCIIAFIGTTLCLFKLKSWTKFIEQQ